MKYFLSILMLLVILSVDAAEFKEIPYKNLKINAKISYDGINWSDKVGRKDKSFYVKQKLEGSDSYTEFYSPVENKSFSTGCQYEFIHKGSLIGYSNYEMKFFEFIIKDGMLTPRPLIEDEVKALFPKYKIVKISDFDTGTNSLKIKKHGKKMKLLMLNDTDKFFYNYAFTTNNAKYDLYELKGFIDIRQKGLIQFSRFGENSKNSNWFVLLVR